MTKGELREHLEQQAGEGGARDQTLALDDAAVVVDEGRASVDPVGYRSPTGGSFLEFRMVRETDGAWRCQAVNGSSLADSATTSR